MHFDVYKFWVELVWWGPLLNSMNLLECIVSNRLLLHIQQSIIIEYKYTPERFCRILFFYFCWIKYKRSSSHPPNTYNSPCISRRNFLFHIKSFSCIFISIQRTKQKSENKWSYNSISIHWANKCRVLPKQRN